MFQTNWILKFRGTLTKHWDVANVCITHHVGRYHELVTLDHRLISGAVGGNIAGGLLKNISLGPVGNSIAGILGGGVGGQLLGMLVPAISGAAGGGLDLGAVIGQVAGGGVGNAIVMIIVGLIKQAMAK